MKKILLVEDDVFLVKIYELKLRELGYELTVMKDGLGVLETALELKPDLILLDLILPSKDGFEVLKELRSEKSLQTVPVVILTNLSQKIDIEQGKKLGASEYMIKSDNSFEKVAETIESIIG